MQNSTSKEYGDLIALRKARRKDTWTPWTRILMKTWENELNHEEPPWRTPVTKGWWDRMKDERIRWAWRCFRWGFWLNGRGSLNSGKEKMKTLGTRIYSPRTNSKGRDYSLGWNKNKIYCMLILHQIKLMTSNGFCILLILLEKDWEVTYHNLEKVFMNHRLDWKEWMNWNDNQRQRNLKEPP